jgi:hypothetical protein
VKKRMEKDFSKDSATSRTNSFIPCRDCGTEIHFDDSIVSRNGKKIPLDKDGKPHQCQNRQRFRTSGTGNSSIVSGIDVQSEVALKLLQSQKEIKLEVKAGLEHITQHLNYLQSELQRLMTEGGRH